MLSQYRTRDPIGEARWLSQLFENKKKPVYLRQLYKDAALTEALVKVHRFPGQRPGMKIGVFNTIMASKMQVVWRKSTLKSPDRTDQV
jgi:hypothetical protein